MRLKTMLEIFQTGGFLMWLLFICSAVAIAIIVERFWSLQSKRISPPTLIPQIWEWLKAGQIDSKRISKLQRNSPLGQILAAGLANRDASREITKENIEDIGRHVTLSLEKNLTTLGTIAAIAPLLGLLGTVIGMIKVFAVITTNNPENLASGISQALFTTAAGLFVAIPSLIFYRYFRGKVNVLVVDMEEKAMKLVEILHGERDYIEPKEK